MKLARKQKILLTLIIILGAFLLWQLYDMFGGSSSNNTAPTVTATTVATKTVRPNTVTSTTTTVANLPSAASTTVTTSAPQQISTMPAAAAPAPMQQMTIQSPMSADQMEYLRLVNRYQLEKMRHMLFDEVAATTASRLKVAQLTQQMQQLNGTQTTAQPVYGTGANINIGYQLMYIDFQNGRWTATLNSNGRFQEVTAGQTLIDGTQIIKINQNGVVVNRRGRAYLISFYGTTVLNDASAQYFATPPNNPVIPVVRPRPMPPRAMPPRAKNVVSKSCKGKPVASMVPVSQRPIPVSMLPPAPMTPIKPIMNNPKVTTTVTTNVMPSGNLPPATLNNNAVAKTTVTTPATLNNPVVTKSTVNNSTVTTTVMVKPASVTAPTSMTLLAPTAVATTTTTTSSVPPIPSGPAAANSGKATLQLTPQQKNTVTQIESAIPAKTNNYSTDEKTLLNLSPDYFTLQLMGSYRLSDLTNFIKDNQLKDKAFAFHTFYLNKDWYVLIYGVYKTQQDALNAIANLPTAVKNLKPWVRNISSVQEAIKGTSKN